MIAGLFLERAFTPPTSTQPAQPVATSVDVEIFKATPGPTGTASGAYIYYDNSCDLELDCFPYSGDHSDLRAAFSFAPLHEFVEVNFIGVTFVYGSGFHEMPETLLVRMNTGSFSILTLCSTSANRTTTTQVCIAGDGLGRGLDELARDIVPGFNTIDILPNIHPPVTPVTDLFLYEVRLTVRYTYIP